MPGSSLSPQRRSEIAVIPRSWNYSFSAIPRLAPSNTNPKPFWRDFTMSPRLTWDVPAAHVGWLDLLGTAVQVRDSAIRGGHCTEFAATWGAPHGTVGCDAVLARGLRGCREQGRADDQGHHHDCRDSLGFHVFLPRSFWVRFFRLAEGERQWRCQFCGGVKTKLQVVMKKRLRVCMFATRHLGVVGGTAAGGCSSRKMHEFKPLKHNMLVGSAIRISW